MTEASEDRTNVDAVTGEVADAVEVSETGAKFIEWLAQHRAGVLDIDLYEAFTEVLTAVRVTGKGGSVVLTLKIEPQKGGAITVADKIDAKPPVELDPRIYFLDADGSLTRENPMAPKLALPPTTQE